MLTDGVSLRTFAGDLTNAGSLHVGDTATFGVRDQLNQRATLNNEQGSDSTITGAGTIDANVVNGFTGVIAPGDRQVPGIYLVEIATLSITGDLTLSGGSGPDGVEIDIAGSGNNDLLSIGGALALAGAGSRPAVVVHSRRRRAVPDRHRHPRLDHRSVLRHQRRLRRSTTSPRSSTVPAATSSSRPASSPSPAPPPWPSPA